MSTTTKRTSRPRTWTVRGRDRQDRVVESWKFTDKDAARRQAQVWANQYGNPFRVSTRGQFGSFTVDPS